MIQFSVERYIKSFQDETLKQKKPRLIRSFYNAVGGGIEPPRGS